MCSVFQMHEQSETRSEDSFINDKILSTWTLSKMYHVSKKILQTTETKFQRTEKFQKRSALAQDQPDPVEVKTITS